MTHLSETAHTEQLGVAEVTRVCAKARMAFRPTTVYDIGIDGFIEVSEDGNATGIIGGVQIKTGDSFVSEEGKRFRFISDQEHFAYWARCSIPIIGIVFSPEFERAVWFDITTLATDKRIVEGPYSITFDYNEKTAFNPQTLHQLITPIIQQYSHQRRTLWEVRKLLSSQRQKAEHFVVKIPILVPFKSRLIG